MTGWRCFDPPPRAADDVAAMLRASLTGPELRSCAARKGWRTRRAQEEETQ